MNIKVHILNASGALNGLEDVIKNTVDATVEKVIKVLPIDSVDIVVSDNPWHIIPNYGLGGITYTSHYFEAAIDPKFPNITQQIQKELPHTISHELHHCMRIRSLGRRKTLLDAIIQEGMADHFAIEVTGLKPEPWSTAVKGKRLQEVLKKAEKEYFTTDYDYYNWFFSENKTEIPHWAGYAIGFYLIDQYLKKHPHQKPSMLYALQAKAFLQ